MPSAPVDSKALEDSVNALTTSRDIVYVLQEAHSIEVRKVTYQLNVRSAVVDSLDHVFKITLDSSDTRVFDMVVSKETFDSYLSDAVRASARLGKLRFSKHNDGSWSFTTYMGMLNSSAMDKIDFYVECLEISNCSITSWTVNDTLHVQACLG